MSATLRAVFFDIGGTLAAVTKDGGAYQLHAYAASRTLLEQTSQNLKLRTGVITNVPEDLSRQALLDLLDAAGLLPLLDPQAIVTSRDAGAAKPDRAIYLYAAATLGLQPAECLYVGEDAGEVIGAQAAGMTGLLKPVPDE